ncbi:metallophosphoesterase [Actinotalea sp. C106]|uniref:metallophosphoesterase family protein n=1 Tax=Actinotalea sp. C106 TaxID=2908644 RepID=UPI0020294675|nr:YfcE family phosphodiesterase [Actinotalea sp. C106]
MARVVTEAGSPLEVVLLADTHWPRRARELPDEVWEAVERADLVVHAGDWVDLRLLDEIEERSRTLLGCWGNNDGPEIRARLPEVARAEVAGVRVGVVHETGPRGGREARMDAAYAEELDLLVFGHSHIPWDTTTPRGLRLLNPGSPTDRRRQPHKTWMSARVGAGLPGYAEVVLHRVGERV